MIQYITRNIIFFAMGQHKGILSFSHQGSILPIRSQFRQFYEVWRAWLPEFKIDHWHSFTFSVWNYHIQITFFLNVFMDQRISPFLLIVCVVLITSILLLFFGVTWLRSIFSDWQANQAHKKETKFILVMKVTLNHIIWAMLVGGSSTLVAGMCMQLSNP